MLPLFVTLLSSPVTDGGISLQCGAVLKLMAMSLVSLSEPGDCISVPGLEVPKQQFIPPHVLVSTEITLNRTLSVPS